MSFASKACVFTATLALFVSGCSDEPAETKPDPKVDPAQLEPPPSGEGFQIRTGEFEVAPGDEVQDCYFFQVKDVAGAAGVPVDQPVNLHRIQIAQREGSHHMNIFRVRDISGLDPKNGAVQYGKNGDGECFDSSNYATWPLVANSQQGGQQDWTYPDGVANVFDPEEWLMLQTHYVNATTQQTPEKAIVVANFWTVPAAQVHFELGTLFATKQSIRVCQSNPQPRYEGACQFTSPDPVTIIGANGHFHSRGTQFDMYAWDGMTPSTPPESDHFYASEAWDDPPMLTSPDLQLTVPPFAGVWYGCSYQWTEPEVAVGCAGLDAYDKAHSGTPDSELDCCYTFGGVVEKNEHCNIFVYYYPKIDDFNCF